MGEWNLLDHMLAKMRARKIIKYIPENAILVDVGCGVHYELLKELKSYIRKGYGIDLNVENRVDDNLILKKANIEECLPLKESSADVVVMLALIEHLDHPLKALRKIRKVLRNNGILLITTPTPYSKHLLEVCAKIGILDRDEIFSHKRYFSKRELIEILRKAGFKVLLHRYFQFYLNQYVVAKKLKSAFYDK